MQIFKEHFHRIKFPPKAGYGASSGSVSGRRNLRISRVITKYMSK